MTMLPLPTFAEADDVCHSLCLSCGMCNMICPTRALHPQGDASHIGEGKRMPRLQPTLCQHCGSCAAVCPSDTIHQPRFRQLSLQVRENPVHTLIFLCRNTLLLAPRPADLGPIPTDMPLLRAFASPVLHHVQPPEGARLEVVRCAHRVGARFLDKLVQNGVRNILLLTCPESRCLYRQSALEHVPQPAVMQAVYEAYSIKTHIEVQEVVPQSAAEVQSIIDEFMSKNIQS